MVIGIVLRRPSYLKDDGRRKINANMGFKIVAKGFNCLCMQSCRSFFEALLGDVNYVHYVNICSLLPFKNY